MAVIVGSRKDVEDYINSPNVRQSTLKDLLKGFNSFMAEQNKKVNPFEETNRSFIIGSAVDVILTGREGQFEEEYYVSRLESKPSDKEMEMTNEMFQIIRETTKPIGDLSMYEDVILKVTAKHEWQPRYKESTKINKILENCSEYFKEIRLSLGKQIISLEEDNIIQNVVKSLRENENTSKYFNRDFFTNNDEVSIAYQLPLYFEVDGVDSKALLDILIMVKDPATQALKCLIPIDLKTMYGYTEDFINNVRRLRYDIQGAFYTEALRQNYPNVEIKNFKFIVESTSTPGNPLIYEMSDALLDIGVHGISEVSQGDVIIRYKVKGYKDLISEYKYYSENHWRESKVIAEGTREGVLTLDWNGIITNTENGN